MPSLHCTGTSAGYNGTNVTTDITTTSVLATSTSEFVNVTDKTNVSEEAVRSGYYFNTRITIIFTITDLKLIKSLRFTILFQSV